MSSLVRLSIAAVLAATLACGFPPRPGIAGTAAEIDADVDKAIADLHGRSGEAKALAERAKGILVFPKIVKGGFIVGAQAGKGALRKGDRTAGYYHSVAASYGLQAGLQWFGYAMYFMNDSALAYLDKSDGWEVGVGPNIVVVDEAAAGSFTTTSAKDDVYVFFFEQKGLMAGLGLQGTKISRYTPED